MSIYNYIIHNYSKRSNSCSAVFHPFSLRSPGRSSALKSASGATCAVLELLAPQPMAKTNEDLSRSSAIRATAVQ